MHLKNWEQSQVEKRKGGKTVSKIKTTDKRKVQSKTESGQRTAETEKGTLTVRMRKNTVETNM